MRVRNQIQNIRCIVAAIGLTILVSLPGRAGAAEGEIRVIVRGDDIGSCHAANVACIKSCREGVVRSLEVMVPAPWFNEAVEMLNENPSIDVGVHLDLTAEWANFKWGPLTNAPSLVDPMGHFLPTTSQRQDFPPNTGFLQSKWKIEEVEKELRVQIETAKARIKNVSHLSSHMGTPTCTKELRALVERLAEEYKLPLNVPDTKRFPRWSGSDKSPDEKEAGLVEAFKSIGPGLYLIVEHPGLDTPEMTSIGHKGYENVGADRVGVTQAFCSPKVKAVIKERNIQLLSYADALKN